MVNLQENAYQLILSLKNAFCTSILRLFWRKVRIFSNLEKLGKNDEEREFFEKKESFRPFKRHPGLTAMVKHDDHAMTCYDHGDS